jgi:hypothetical protein
MKGLSDSGPIVPMVGLAIAWLSCSVYVARTTPLRTNVRYLHAILSFPVLLLLVPAGVMIAKVLLSPLGSSIEGMSALSALSADGRRHLAEMAAIALAVPLPAFLFWRYRCSMDRREQRALERFRDEGV